MKSFKQHLLESKQVYEFKIKIAGAEPDEFAIDRLKSALAKFTVESFSKGISTPIQETQVDFPDHNNVGTTTYDVILTYPATSVEIRQLAKDALKLSECCIKVRNLKEQEEQALNHQYDTPSGESLLTKDYDKECHQDLVGEARKMSMLKELNKVKHQGEQYKGVNDELLAKNAPVAKSTSEPANKKCNSSSVIGSRKVTLPTAKGIK